MKFALVSDIHGNLESLTAVFAQIDPHERVLCLGDIVGYGPDPNACLRLVRERAFATVLGNHDVAAVDSHGLAYFNDAAREAIAWTQTVLEAEHVAWLDGLSYEVRMPEYLLVHGAPVDYFRYILDLASATQAFADTDAPIVFVGHTHVADFYALSPDGTIAHEFRQQEGRLTIREGFRYVINVGSVGQPRDHNPEASFVRYDSESATVSWHRVPYAIAETQRKIGEARLPEALARRLEAGR